MLQIDAPHRKFMASPLRHIPLHWTAESVLDVGATTDYPPISFYYY